ncbi:MAG: integration host factor subunit beta [Sterolibacterium sp.]
MTRSEPIYKLTERYPALTGNDVEAAVKIILEALSNFLASGSRVEIRGFGSFDLNYRLPRLGRNPRSGEKVHVPAKTVPHFKAGKELRDRVNSSRG